MCVWLQLNRIKKQTKKPNNKKKKLNPQLHFHGVFCFVFRENSKEIEQREKKGEKKRDI